MPDISPSCFVSDGTTIFAAYIPVFQKSITLIKSNPNPGSVLDLTWSLVSSASTDNLYILRDTGNVVCNMDNRGVFTILTASSSSTSMDATSSRPRGFQFDPSGADGKGAWSNVDVSDGYNWSPFSTSTMANIQNKDGGSGLLHIFLQHEASSLTVSSIFNETSRTFSKQTESWPQHESFYRPLVLVVGDGILYSIIENRGQQSIVALTTAPISIPPPSKENSIPTNIGSLCDVFRANIRAGVYKSKLYAFCTGGNEMSNYLFTYDGTAMSDGVLVKTNIQKVLNFIPIGPSDGSTPWALVTNSTGIFGVSLSGSNLGTFDTLPYKINYTDPNAKGKGNAGNNNDNGNRGNSGNSGSSGPGSTTNTTPDKDNSDGLPPVAIIFMVIIPVLLAALFARWYRRKSRRKGSEVILADFHPMDPVASHSKLPSSGSQYPLMSLSETSQSFGQPAQGQYDQAVFMPYPPLPTATSYPPVPPKPIEDEEQHKISVTDSPQAYPPSPGNPQTHVMGSSGLGTPSFVTMSPFTSNASTAVGSGYNTPITVHNRLDLESSQLHSVPHAPHGPYPEDVPFPMPQDPSRNPQVYHMPVPGPQLYAPGMNIEAGTASDAEIRRAPQGRNAVHENQDYHN